MTMLTIQHLNIKQMSLYRKNSIYPCLLLSVIIYLQKGLPKAKPLLGASKLC